MLLALGLGTAALAACPTPAPTSVLLFSHLTAAQQAYVALDVPRFRDLMDQVHADLPCVSDEVTKHLAAEIHRYEGLEAFLDRSQDRSTKAFAAARSVEPTYRFPDAVVPAGNPVLADYTALDPDDGRTERVAPPLDGRIQFDGQPTETRPADFPTLFQLIDSEGRVRATAYLWPGDPLPDYPAGEIPKAADATGGRHQDVTELVHRGPDRRWLAGAVTAAVVSGGLYGGAYVVHQKYYATTTPIGQLDGLRSVNNTLVVASGGVAVAAVGLGAGAFLVGRF
jgi:hypothetical protein